MEKIKLVIWDMDNTFWKGTLAEGDIEIRQKNLNIVRQLTDRGIINSICSKNDFLPVKNRLVKEGIWDFFVFPSVSYEPKGTAVKNLLKQMLLRPENTLFIDDDVRNLEEVSFYNPNINTSLPDIIDKMLDMPQFDGEDLNHDRLKRYKLLEEKARDKVQYSSNREFLLNSNIKVYINGGGDILNHSERIFELIERTNQLNFTKNRISKTELQTLLTSPSHQNYYVVVEDRYGKYGVVGFCSVCREELEHFLFSCRIIGMGVEQYVYNALGCPKLIERGDVVSHVNNSANVDWINMGQDNSPDDNTDQNNLEDQIKKNIVLRGGCDLYSMMSYIHNKSITTEFNFRRFHRDHTFLTCGCIRYDRKMQNFLTKNIAFLNDDCFDTEIFSPKTDVVVLSLLMDYVQKVYHLKDNPEIKVAYGDFNKNLDFTAFDCSETGEEFIRNELIPDGRISLEQFKENLQYIRDHIDKRKLLILINGCEVPSTNPDEYGREKIHQEYNHVVDEFVNDHRENTKLLDMRKLVLSQDNLADNIRHYKRDVYYKMAMELSHLLQSQDVYLSAEEAEEKKIL